MTDSTNQTRDVDYWTAQNPNALNEYDDGLNPVWINHEPKAKVYAEHKSVRVYQNPNHCRNCWLSNDWYNYG